MNDSHHTGIVPSFTSANFPHLVRTLDELIKLWISPDPAADRLNELLDEVKKMYFTEQFFENNTLGINGDGVPYVLQFMYDIRQYTSDFLFEYFQNPHKFSSTPFYLPPDKLTSRVDFAIEFYRTEASIYSLLGVSNAINLNDKIASCSEDKELQPYTPGTEETLKAERIYQMTYTKIATMDKADSILLSLARMQAVAFQKKTFDALQHLEVALDFPKAELLEKYKEYSSNPENIVRTIHDVFLNAFFKGLEEPRSSPTYHSVIEKLAFSSGMEISLANQPV